MTRFNDERQSAAKQSGRASRAPGKNDSSSPTIVVADANPEARAAIADALRHDGYDVVEASDTRAVLDALEHPHARRHPPALIVSEVRMPGLDGIELAALVRARGHGMPILLQTASADEDLVSLASRAGATAVFSKPFDLDDLRTAVASFAPRPVLASVLVRKPRLDLYRAHP